MNAGSKKITVRVGDALLAAIDEAVLRLNGPKATAAWTRSDFVVKAITDKLSHMYRSKGERIAVHAIKIEENAPREYSEDEY